MLEHLSTKRGLLVGNPESGRFFRNAFPSHKMRNKGSKLKKMINLTLFDRKKVKFVSENRLAIGFASPY